MKKVVVNNLLQDKYAYYLKEPEGKNFDPEFKPDLTPKQMLKLGVFGGHYMDEKEWKSEFPKTWFSGVEFSEIAKKSELNFFKISASQSLSVWEDKGWIYKDDPYGWFQWYCRYYRGRRLDDGEDKRQIERWKAIKRHASAVKKNCKKGDLNCRPKQRQALLHWAYDSRKI